MSGMEGLRRGAQNVNNGKGGKGGKARGYYARWKPPYMADNLKPFLAAPPSEEARMGVSEPIVLIRGEYPDLYARDENGNPIIPPPVIEGLRFRAHTFNVNVPGKNGQKGYSQFRDITCSAGPEAHNPQPCVGCRQNDQGVEGKPRDQWAFEIAHLNWYHLSPLVKDGQVQTKRGSNEPVLVKNLCDRQQKYNQVLARAHQANPRDWKEPYDCEGCKGQHPWAFGDHRIIQVGKNHLVNLLDVNDKVGQKCGTCGTVILRIAFDCGNQNCDNEILDVASSGWTNAQLDQFSKMPCQCMKCGYQGLPVPVYSCGYNENFQKVAEECQNPVQQSIWDSVLWVQREGESTDSKLVITRIDPIATFATPDGRPLWDHLKEIVKEQFDLAEMYKPDSLDEQTKRLCLQANPFAVSQQQYGQYPGAQQPASYGPPQGGYQQPQGQYQPPQQGQQPWGPPGRPNYGK